MVKPKSSTQREVFSTRINPDIIKQLKYLSVDLNKPLNSLLEEAMTLLLQKYKKAAK